MIFFDTYIENFKLCETEHLKLNTEHSLLFRPPYGKMTLSQSKKIQKLGYKIIMWDVLSYDFKPSITAEKSFRAPAPPPFCIYNSIYVY